MEEYESGIKKVTETLLRISDLRKKFGGLIAVDRLNLEVKTSEIQSIIGPNGAGKTTLFNLISGFLRPSNGKILFEGREIHSLKPHEISSLGIARTFQNLAIFGQMTVLENVMIGFHKSTQATFITGGLQLPSVKREEEEARKKSLELLSLFHLEKYADDLASNLPYGKQKLLEVARALASNPELILLDEPAAGLNSMEAEEILQMIRKIRDHGVTILLVEHNIRLVMKISDKITVLNYGKKIAEGTPTEISKDAGVINAYLGEAI